VPFNEGDELRIPDALRSPVWPGILAAIAVVGLLLAFHQVVSGAVQQGELRRKATAAYAEAAWRCNALRGVRAVRESCLSQLNAPHNETTLQARNFATESVVQISSR